MRTRLLGLFTAVLFAVAGLTVVMAQQTAEASDPPRYGDPIMPSGFQPIPIQWMHLQRWMSRFPNNPVLKVDTAHATDEGFWFAIRNNATSGRAVQWNYQQYGIGCDAEEFYNLVFNPWLNTYWCAEDPTAFEAYAPGYQQRTDACRAEKGQPWKSFRTDGSNQCWNRELYQGDMVPLAFQYPNVAYGAAPWETAADYNDPSWATMQPLDFWVPEPDTCTGAPASANRVYYEATDDNVASNVPNCKGQDLAPNCTAATASDPACGGPVWSGAPSTPTATPTATASATGTSSPTVSPTSTAGPSSYTSTRTAIGTANVEGFGRATKVATARIVRRTVSVTVTKTVDGREITKVGNADIVVTREAQASAESRLTDTFTAEGTGTCTGTTQAQADDCAEARARADGERIAREQNAAAMKKRAEDDAAAKAYAEALRRATTAAKDTVITKAMIRKAKKQARRDALAQF